jgi:hypothetical protein
MVLDLQGGRADLGVAQQVENQRALEVGDTNRVCVSFSNQVLHCGPRLLDRGIAQLDTAPAIVAPFRRIPDRGINPSEGHGEMDHVQIEVINAPVLQLLLGNGLDLVAVMEGVPELADSVSNSVTAVNTAVF